MQREIDENDAALRRLIQREKQRERTQSRWWVRWVRTAHGQCEQLVMRELHHDDLCSFGHIFTVECLMFRELKVD